MNTHEIIGGGGARLHVIETGNRRGTPFLFIHGFSQCGLAWKRQLVSDLAEDCRLIAMDLRGHGLSERPRDAYADAQLWAQDVHAVIEGLALDRPILCGWSYGPLVILDYLRHYGEAHIRGANFVGGVTKLGSEAATGVLGAGFLALVPGFFSTDAEESVRSLDALVRLCFASELSAEERWCMLGYNASVPPHVRQALLSRVIDNDDLLPGLRTPVLVTNGVADAVVSSASIEQQMRRIPRLSVEMIAEAGHACFWDNAPAYNRCLREFAASV